MPKVKLLGPADADLLDKVAADVFDDPIVKSSAEEFLNDARHRLVVALEGNLVVGFASAVVYLHPDKPAPELWINEIGVAPTHQRQGIGKLLLQSLLDNAKESGCIEAWVLTERENSAAMAMYRSAGGIEEMPDPTMFTFTL
jgi:ribosomal protein S18 acetylase RimI-like enzyme